MHTPLYCEKVILLDGTKFPLLPKPVLVLHFRTLQDFDAFATNPKWSKSSHVPNKGSKIIFLGGFNWVWFGHGLLKTYKNIVGHGLVLDVPSGSG